MVTRLGCRKVFDEMKYEMISVIIVYLRAKTKNASLLSAVLCRGWRGRCLGGRRDESPMSEYAVLIFAPSWQAVERKKKSKCRRISGKIRSPLFPPRKKQKNCYCHVTIAKRSRLEVMQGADFVRFDFFILTFLIAGLYSLFCAFSFVAGGVGGHALFFSAGLLQQMSHSHVPIKNKRPVIFCALEFLIFARMS